MRRVEPMKKKLLIIMGALILCLIVLAIGSSGDDPLDPEVQKELSFRFPEVAPEENAYVGVSGLGGIADGDVVAAGQKYLKEGPALQPDPAQDKPFDFSYKNPCLAEGSGRECLDAIVADAAAIDEAVKKNGEIIERYYVVQQMPLYVNDSVSFMAPVPRFHHLLDVSKLIGAKALLDIKRHGLDPALNSIEKDLDFYERICRSEHISMIELMISIAAIKNNLVELNKIIEDDQVDLGGYEDRLRKMLDLDLNSTQMLTVALKSERRQFIQGFDEAITEFSDEGLSPQYKWMKPFYRLIFKRNMTLNRIASRMTETINQVQAAPLLGFPDFYARHEMEMADGHSSYTAELTIKDLYNAYGLFFFKNYVGEHMANIAQPYYMRYAARANETIVYSHLLRAQLELRLMAERPDDISEALAVLGPETWNPYTGQPFAWDREKNTIWAESVIRKGGGRDNDPSSGRLEVAAPFSRPQ